MAREANLASWSLLKIDAIDRGEVRPEVTFRSHFDCVTFPEFEIPVEFTIFDRGNRLERCQHWEFGTPEIVRES